MNAIRHLAVVIPARNEAASLDRCLAAVAVAMAHLRDAEPAVESRLIVVLDRCTDGSAAVVAAHPGVTAVSTTVGMVGAARRLGADIALSAVAEPATAWIACTDADSAPSPDWLRRQLELAAAGAEMVLGTVVPSRDDLTEAIFDEWSQRHQSDEGHSCVHGANLGIRGDLYRRVGGFARVAEHEDVLLATAARRAGGRVVSTASCPVTTSGRPRGRTPGGFAGYLAALEGEMSIGVLTDADRSA